MLMSWEASPRCSTAANHCGPAPCAEHSRATMRPGLPEVNIRIDVNATNDSNNNNDIRTRCRCPCRYGHVSTSTHMRLLSSTTMAQLSAAVVDTPRDRDREVKHRCREFLPCMQYNLLDGNLPETSGPALNILRSATIGFSSATVSAVASNWARVIKTNKQTSPDPRASYVQVRPRLPPPRQSPASPIGCACAALQCNHRPVGAADLLNRGLSC